VLPVQVNTTGVTVGNGATVQLTSGGGCWGSSGAAGSINLGASAGNVVVTSNFNLGNCVLSGSGNLTLNSSSAQVYVLAQGNHAAGYIIAQGNAQLSLSGGATTISGNVWIGGTGGRLTVQQSSASTNTQVNGNVWIVAQGTYSVAINSALTVSGTFGLGSDTISGVTPTLTVAYNVWANAGSLTLNTGGNVALSAGGGLAASSVTVTGSSSTTNTVSGAGMFNVTTSFTAMTSGATVQVNCPFLLTGSLAVSNNATLVVSGSGWSSGSINLGASGQGGTLVIQGAWSHSSTPSGGGGTIVFSPSVSNDYNLVAGTYAVLWIKAKQQAHLWVSAASSTVISGSLWVQDSARVTVNQTLTVAQAITVAGSGILEVAEADVMATAVTFQSSSQYILFAATSNPPKVTVSGEATFSGTIHIVSQPLVAGTANVTVAVYASYTGAFGTVTAAANGNVGMGVHPMYATSRRLLSSSSNGACVNYGNTSAEAYSCNSNGVTGLSPSILLGLIVFVLVLLLQ